MKIGIIGLGMVGGAVFAGSQKCESISTYDVVQSLTTNWDMAWQTDLCFICVPTPTIGGRQDFAAIIDACERLRGMSVEGYKGVVVIKSTVLPGTMQYLCERFPQLKFVHNPEFLCERTAKSDYLGQTTVLASGNMEDMRVFRRYCHLCLPELRTIQYSENYLATEWAKYIHNCVLPVKLSFLNEVYDVIGSQSIFDEAVEMATWFGNVGTHSRVPGPDGKRGWGGACFPKDTKALETFALRHGHKMSTLTGAINTNMKVRGEK